MNWLRRRMKAPERGVLDFGLALCAALELDPKEVRSITIHAEAGLLPTCTVDLVFVVNDEVMKAVRNYVLVPTAKEDES